MSERTATVAVDAIGGDRAPGVVLEGVTAAVAANEGLHILLVGPEAIVTPMAADRVTPVVATEVIAMDEHPASAVRSKKDSSIVVGCRLVREGSAEAFFSAGSTGACMAAATLGMGRIAGVTRPAIAAVIPGSGGPSVLLDVGANADVKADMLVEFALMGAAYARIVLGVSSPRVALLNIGEEPTKGSLLAQEAYASMTDRVPGFVGNIEGRDVSTGKVDVIVTDGFTGNVTLKVLEGLAAALFGEIRTAMTENALGTLAAAVLRPSLRRMRDRLDPDAYGGAPLLGVRGVCIIGHGSAGPRAIANGIAVGARAVRGGLTDAIASGIASLEG
jgi:glycerol-3-phosphate acyltransferase PlsX